MAYKCLVTVYCGGFCRCKKGRNRDAPKFTQGGGGQREPGNELSRTKTKQKIKPNNFLQIIIFERKIIYIF
jgi:hypothetical protein